MKFIGLKVGDKVSVQQHRGNGKWTVTKVGRKYFTAGGCEFLIEDGTSKSGYSYPRASTLEEEDRRTRAAAARNALEAFGLKLDWSTKEEKILIAFEALQHLLPSDSPSPPEKP